MKQSVLIVKHADRHESEERDFAETYEYVVHAGNVLVTLDGLLGELDNVPRTELETRFPQGRYTILIGEPYDEE